MIVAQVAGLAELAQRLPLAPAEARVMLGVPA